MWKSIENENYCRLEKQSQMSVWGKWFSTTEINVPYRTEAQRPQELTNELDCRFPMWLLLVIYLKYLLMLTHKMSMHNKSSLAV